MLFISWEKKQNRRGLFVASVRVLSCEVVTESKKGAGAPPAYAAMPSSWCTDLLLLQRLGGEKRCSGERLTTDVRGLQLASAPNPASVGNQHNEILQYKNRLDKMSHHTTEQHGSAGGGGFLSKLRGQAEAALAKVPAYNEMQHVVRQGMVQGQ